MDFFASTSSDVPGFRPPHRNRKAATLGQQPSLFGRLFGCRICTSSELQSAEAFTDNVVQQCGDAVRGGAENIDIYREDTDEGCRDQFYYHDFSAEGAHSPAHQQLEKVQALAGDVFDSHEFEVMLVDAPDRYIINGRPVRMSLLPEGTASTDFSHHTNLFSHEGALAAARLMVHDGPLKQPFLDYLSHSGLHEQWDHRGTENPHALNGMAKLWEPDNLISAAAVGRVEESGSFSGSRIEAMQVAAAQADRRHLMETTDAIKKNLASCQRGDKLGAAFPWMAGDSAYSNVARMFSSPVLDRSAGPAGSAQTGRLAIPPEPRTDSRQSWQTWQSRSTGRDSNLFLTSSPSALTNVQAPMRLL